MADALNIQSDSAIDFSEAFDDTEIDRELPRSEFLGNAQATIYPVDQGGEPVRCTVLTRDLSNRGFGIAHHEPVRPRQRVELETPQRRLAGEVLWCRQIRPGFYIIGCRRLD